MFYTGLGQAEGSITDKVVSRVIEMCRDGIGDRSPQAGILLSGPNFDHELMLAMINEAFPGIAIVGATTAGEFSSSYGFSEDSISLLVLSSDSIQMSTGVGSGLSGDLQGAVDEALASARASLQGEPSFCLTFPAFGTNPESTLAALTEALGTECPVFGGVAGTLWSDNVEIRQFHNRSVHSDSIPVLLFSGPIRHEFAIAKSWQPLGPTVRVSQVLDNTVHRIGEMTAVEFYRYYLGYHTQPAREFILAVYEPGTTEYYLTTPMEYHENGSITFSHSLPEGAAVQLTEAIRGNLLQDTEQTSARLKEMTQEWNPAVALCFSCSFRKEILGTDAQEELAILERNLPEDIPLLGFFSFGEISPLVKNARSKVQGAALVTLLLGPGSDGANRTVHRATDTGQDAVCHLYDDQFFKKKFTRSEQYRQRTESLKEFSSRMHRRIMTEVIEARRKIHEQEVELRKSEEKHRRIVQTAGEGFILMNEKHQIVDTNEAYCKMLGYTQEEVLGKSNLDFATSEFKHFIEANREKLLSREARRLEGTLVTKEGQEVPVLIHSNVLRDDNGKNIGQMAFITDLTDQKKALALAGEVQRSLLPQENPKVHGLDIAGRNISCDEVGGDYYDFFLQQDRSSNSFSVAVGDITGHGVDAALLMSSARAFLRMHVSSNESLTDIVEAMNRHLSDDVMESGRFMTLFYLAVSPDLTKIEWVRAGHDPAILFDPATGEFETLKGPGLALGIDPTYPYESQSRENLRDGNVIAIGTDGIWETHNQKGEMFGRSRFETLLKENAEKPAADILNRVFDELEIFRGGQKADDDITLVIIKIKNRGGESSR